MIRRALLAVLVALATLTTVTSAPAHARACRIDYHCETTYYSDGSYTTVVGAKYEDCVGNESHWGTRGYPVFVETPC